MVRCLRVDEPEAEEEVGDVSLEGLELAVHHGGGAVLLHQRGEVAEAPLHPAVLLDDGEERVDERRRRRELALDGQVDALHLEHLNEGRRRRRGEAAAG